MTQQEKDRFIRLLGELRNDLVETSSIRDETSATVNLDQSCTGRLSRMDALQGQAIAVAGKARAEHTLRLISAALQRIEEDEFGYCAECGEEINPKRLEIDPVTLYCIECAASRQG